MFIINTNIYLKKFDLTKINQIKTKSVNKELLSESEINYLLDYITLITRKELILSDSSLDIKISPLINKCNTASRIASQLLEELNIDTRYLRTQDVISEFVTGHDFLVANIQNTPYLIDLTYRQFFLKEQCKKERFCSCKGITYLSPDPGYYYEVNPEHQFIAKTIIENGYVKLTNQIAKIYCDSFYITRRGYVNEYSNTSNISGNVYLSSLLNPKNNLNPKPKKNTLLKR